LGYFRFEGKPIFAIDDLFSEHQDVDSLHPRTDLDVFSKFLFDTYEKRRLVITSSNLSPRRNF